MKPRKLLFVILGIGLWAVPFAPAAAEPPEDSPKVEKKIEAVVIGGEPGETGYRWVDDGEELKVEIVGLEESGLGHLRLRGFLGVELSEITPDLRAHFGAPREAGVLVGRVAEDSPAATAGVRVGDVLTSINGEAVESAWDVRRLVGSLDDGDLAALELVRDGRPVSLEATIQERERPQVDVRHLIRRLPRTGEGRHGEPFVFHFQGEGLPEMMESLKERIESPKFHREVIDLRSRESELLERLDTLERRIEELEAELEKQDR